VGEVALKILDVNPQETDTASLAALFLLIVGVNERIDRDPFGRLERNFPEAGFWLT